MKNKSSIDVALHDGLTCHFDDKEVETVMQSSDYPDRKHLERGVTRLDAASMLLQRIEFGKIKLLALLVAVHLFADSSPVTGSEILGMVADLVLRDGTILRWMLPGSVLAYGNFSALNKTMALVFAVWLLVGPFEAELRYFMDHVISITTDMGVEFGLGDQYDLVGAFMKSLNGTPAHELLPYVNTSRRLMNNSIKIPGCANSWRSALV